MGAEEHFKAPSLNLSLLPRLSSCLASSVSNLQSEEPTRTGLLSAGPRPDEQITAQELQVAEQVLSSVSIKHL